MFGDSITLANDFSIINYSRNPRDGAGNFSVVILSTQDGHSAPCKPLCAALGMSNLLVDHSSILSIPFISLALIVSEVFDNMCYRKCIPISSLGVLLLDLLLDI